MPPDSLFSVGSMKSILKRLRNRLLSLFPSRHGNISNENIINNPSIPVVPSRLPQDGPKAKDLLPQHKPLLASLRPGLQHCQIHDPKYLTQLLEAELRPDSPPPSVGGTTDD
jgi:hypothetical protein